MKVLHNSKSKPGVMAYKGNPSTQKNSKSLRSVWVPYTEWYLVKTKTNNLKKILPQIPKQINSLNIGMKLQKPEIFDLMFGMLISFQVNWI